MNLLAAPSPAPFLFVETASSSIASGLGSILEKAFGMTKKAKKKQTEDEGAAQTQGEDAVLSDREEAESAGRGRKKGGGGKAGPNERANLALKISRVDKRIRSLKVTKRLNKAAGVYATAIIEGVVTQILTDGETQCQREKPQKTRITTMHIAKAARTHPELSRAFGKYSFVNDKVLQKPGNLILTAFDQKTRDEKRKEDKKKREEEKRKKKAPAGKASRS